LQTGDYAQNANRPYKVKSRHAVLDTASPKYGGLRVKPAMTDKILKIECNHWSKKCQNVPI
jgi:hypothetical protein